MQTMIKEMNPSRLEAMRQGFRAAFSHDPARFFPHRDGRKSAATIPTISEAACWLRR